MRLLCVQADVAYGEPDHNLHRALQEMEHAKAGGGDLVVFPEAFLTGYCVDNVTDGESVAIPINSPHLSTIRQRCEDLDLMAVVGFAESDEGVLYNTAAIFEPGKPMRTYRKTHLPYLGYDRFAKPGHDLPVFETRLGRIGIVICFDLRIPEVTRVLALKGAELILVPTNWPEGAEISADHVAIARAAENRVFLAAANRVGGENGFQFIGRSKIIHPSGKVLVSADNEESVLVADIDLSEARSKRAVTIPGRYETDAFATRQPDMYKPLVEILQPVEPV